MKINKNIRYLLIFVISIAAVFFLYSITKDLLYPSTLELKETTFSYNQEGRINYDVNLVPNDIYEEESLEEGRVYIESLIKDLDISLNYQFTSQEDVDIQGDYKLVAIVEGIHNESDSQNPLWQKEYVLNQYQEFEVTGKNHAISEKVTLNLKEYTDFSNAVVERSNVNTQTQLRLLWKININGETVYGTINDTLEPSMIIPLRKQTFSITGNLLEQKPGEFQTVKNINDPNKFNTVLSKSGMLFISLLALLFVIKFTKGFIELDPIKIELKQIFKKHNSRLVELNEDSNITLTNSLTVNSFNDLVKFADEIGEPILYLKIQKSKHLFFVQHNNGKFYIHKVQKSQDYTMYESKENVV